MNCKIEVEKCKIVEEEDLPRKDCGVFLMKGTCEGIRRDLRMKCDVMLLSLTEERRVGVVGE